jgi:iron complex outermembrane receptor protein
MPKITKVHQAILCALYAGTFPQTVQSQVIEEIIVTASKRSESMQDVPLAVQAISSEQLKDLNIQSFSDYVNYLPSVNFGGRGPGQNEIYIRGAAVDAINITVAESQGTAPNVALYLDEQPVTVGGRNLDVYITDMERIEVLPGPQGTLYGSSSMAGTVRLITNKPGVDQFHGSVTGSWSATHDGDDSNSFEAMVNIPIIEGAFAVRAAVYNDNQGGYIDNVEGTFVADNSINLTFPGSIIEYPAGTVFANGTVVGEGGVTIPVVKTVARNSALIEDDFNDAQYRGARLGAKYYFNDEWDLLVQHTRQSLQTEGVFDYDPSKGDLNVSRFSEDSLDDEFNQTAWTVTGRLGALDIVYTGAFLDREIEANVDYTGYTNIGAFVSGYQCEYLVGSFYNGLTTNPSTFYTFDPTIGGDPEVIECGNPAMVAHISNEMTRWTHEFRINTNFEGRVNMTGGIFLEDFEILHIGDFNYQATLDSGWAPIDISSNSVFDNSIANARGVTNAETQFRNDNTRTEKQIAVFGELTWEITEAWSVTMGARYYDLEYGFKGYGAWRYGNRPLFVDDDDPSNDIRPAVTGGRDYEFNFAELEPIKVDDVITKLTVSWKPSDRALLYATWSEGYRPPGLNRAAAREGGLFDPGAQNIRDDGTDCASKVAIDSNPSTGFPGYCLPYVFKSDTLQNIEFGWKTSLADDRVQFNGSIYKVNWDNIQVSQFDSQNISILTVIDNGGDAEITGIEVDLIWAATDKLMLFGAASYNDTELTYVDPAFAVVMADIGSPLPLTPKTQFSLRGRYDWELASSHYVYMQAGVKYAGEAINSLVDTINEPNTIQEAYTLVDASVGLGHAQKGWRTELFIRNLTDERAQLHINRQDFIERTTTNRPRTIGVRVSYDF